MSKPLAFGLNLTKKPSASKSAPVRRKPMFGEDPDSDNDDAKQGAGVQEIGGDLDDFTTTTATEQSQSRRGGPKSKSGLPIQPPKMKIKSQSTAMFGDLSGALESRKNAEAAAQADANIYEYDAVYDSLKPKKLATQEDVQRKPKYMKSLLQAAEVRKRDALIAEEKKIAREREAEGEEYEGTEKFVTGAYKKQQEENRRIEEEEKRKEEEEAKKNQGGGMSAFYKKLLDKDQQRHAEAVKAAENLGKEGSPKPAAEDEEDQGNDKTQEEFAKELNEKGASVAVNEDGQVVDKRQLLRGGLNVGQKKKEAVQKEAERPRERENRNMGGGQFDRKQGMRERQSRMIEEQLEQSAKRSREEEETQRAEVERASKSLKTEGDISSAKERYLARKRAAEEAKKNGSAV